MTAFRGAPQIPLRWREEWMATEQQLATVSRHVNDAVSKGASVLTGGKAETVACR